MLHARYLLTLLLSFLLVPLLAQEPAQPVRLELPFTPEDTEVEVIALPDSSLLVYHSIGNVWRTEATFYFTKYNQELEEVWSYIATLPPDSEFIRHYTAAPYTYLVFGGDDLQEYTFVRLHHKTGSIWHKMFEIEPIDAIYEYQVLQDNYFIIGRNKKDQKSLLLHLDPKAGEVKLLPSIYGEESSFSDLMADQEHRRVDAVITESNGRISRLQVKSFDASGKLIKNYFILQREDKSLLNAEITPGDSTEQLLIGSYGTRDLRFNQGFFAAPLTTRVEDGLFYNMLQLNNFLKYMNPRREERTRRREGNRLKTGRSPSFHYRLLLHDLLVTPHGYVLAAEAYYPQYSSPRSSNMGLDNTLTLYKIPDGIKRTHAVALGFDKNGVLLWDNTFPLPGLTTYELTHAVEVQYLPDGRLVMAYPQNNKIIYHIMDENRYDDSKTELELLTYEESEKVQHTDQSGIVRWYGNNMAAFGFQRIKPKSGDIRTVFYINKITF